jgi:drug/metabolite transporter (DMT)-like permease
MVDTPARARAGVDARAPGLREVVLLWGLLAAVTLALARPQPPARRDWGRLFWFSVFSIIGFPLLMTVAMQYAPASHAAVVLAVLPLLTAMAGVLVASERP